MTPADLPGESDMRAEPRSHLRMKAALDGECPICFHRDLSAVGDRMQSAASRLMRRKLRRLRDAERRKGRATDAGSE